MLWKILQEGAFNGSQPQGFQIQVLTLVLAEGQALVLQQVLSHCGQPIIECSRIIFYHFRCLLLQ